MAYVIYEFNKVNEQGEPVHPAQAITSANLGADYQIQRSDTVFVAVSTGADMHLRVSPDGGDATTNDPKILAGETQGFPVAGRPYLNGTAAA